MVIRSPLERRNLAPTMGLYLTPARQQPVFQIQKKHTHLFLLGETVHIVTAKKRAVQPHENVFLQLFRNHLRTEPVIMRLVSVLENFYLIADL